MVPLLYLHGLSSGDFVPALEQFIGTSAGLSAATVTRLTAQWQDDYKTFTDRDLPGVDYVYVGRRHLRQHPAGGGPPLFAEAARPLRQATGNRWFVDETYVKVAGRWRYLCRAVDQYGQVIDVLLSKQRDTAAARRFFIRALRHGQVPVEVTTDKAGPYLRMLDEPVPTAMHVTEHFANNLPARRDRPDARDRSGTQTERRSPIRQANPVLARALQAHLRWRNANARHPDVLAAQRRERAKIRSERRRRWGHPAIHAG